MAFVSKVPRTRYAALCVLVLLVFATVTVAGAATSGRDGRAAEARMQVSTEGPTLEEYVQQQLETSRWLRSEMPAGSSASPIRVTLTREEIDAIARAPRISATPLQIGIVKPVNPRLDITELGRGDSEGQPRRGATGVATRTGDGGYVWAVAIQAEGAGAFRLHIENVSLPDNAALYVYSSSGESFGPYTRTGPNRSGDFWTTALFGTEGVMQLRLAGPATDADLRAVSFSVTEVGLISPTFGGGSDIGVLAPPPPGWPCGNASCIVDASCVNNAVANNAKLAVAKMEWIQGAFIYTCTGGLLADNNPSDSNFFLTANHCVSKNNAAQNVSFYWRFATPSCNATSCPSNSGWPYITTGSTVSKTGRKGDFTLLHLNSAPPAGSIFLGWTSAPVANTNGAHLFRVSNPNFGPQVYSEHDVDTTAPTCSGWPRGERIYSRDIVGAIDGGSSGSPILNASSQVVGQLSGTCGSNPSQVCSSGPGEANATVDGAFAFYFSLVQPVLAP